MRSCAGLRRVGDSLGDGGLELGGVEVLSGDDTDLSELGHHRRVLGRRRIGLQEFGEELEVGRAIHGVDLLPNGGLHVDGRIDLARFGLVRFAVGRQRHHRKLILQRVHRLVVFGRAGAVDPAEDPDHAGGRLVLGDASRQRARPAGAGDRVLLRLGSGRALAGNLEHISPAVEHREQEVAPLHVRNADDPGLLRHVDPSGRVERVRVGRSDVSELSIGVFAHPDELTHRGARAFRGRDVGHDPPRHLHSDERVGVHIGFGRERQRFHCLCIRLGLRLDLAGSLLDLGFLLLAASSEQCD